MRPRRCPKHLWERWTTFQSQPDADSTGVGVGSTETAPLATDCCGAASVWVIGVPVPGCGSQTPAEWREAEVRVVAQMSFQATGGRPDLTARCFDEEGFYLIGDAVRSWTHRSLTAAYC